MTRGGAAFFFVRRRQDAAVVDALDLIALSLLPVSRCRCIAERLRAGEPPGSILTAQSANGDRSVSDLRAAASRALARAASSGLSRILWSEPLYPPCLAAIIDPPPALWVRGDAAALERPAVAIVGSRAGSPYALAVAEKLAGELAERGVAIVSGLARGVDSAAHRGALSANGVTVAVLGCGADIVYPAEHRALAREITASGAVLSELVPGTVPLPMFFPQRNRIISGVSRAVVIVEAGEKSGSLITARCALDQGRDVLAVPGNVLTGRNRGGHALIRDGAKIVETADDILEELGLPFAAPAGEAPICAEGEPACAGDAVLMSLPPGEACDLDGLAARTGLPAARLLPRLLELELQGFVRRAGGGRFVRFDRSC
jgi:DNA processing protein